MSYKKTVSYKSKSNFFVFVVFLFAFVKRYFVLKYVESWWLISELTTMVTHLHSYPIYKDKWTKSSLNTNHATIWEYYLFKLFHSFKFVLSIIFFFFKFFYVLKNSCIIFLCLIRLLLMEFWHKSRKRKKISILKVCRWNHVL